MEPLCPVSLSWDACYVINEILNDTKNEFYEFNPLQQHSFYDPYIYVQEQEEEEPWYC